MARGRKKASEEEVLTNTNEEVSTEVETPEEEIIVNNEETVNVEASETVEGQEQEQIEVVTEYLSDTTGKPISRSAYIRQEFMKDKSRGQIAKELGCAYGIVYSATTNMENAVHKNTDGVSAARGVVIEHPVTKENISRADYCREQVEAGRSRGDVAKELGVAYATVYAATKDLKVSGSAGGARVVVEVDGEKKGRADYIRELFAEGKTRREIANEIGCDYAVVWAATKTLTEKVEDQASVEASQDEVSE
jgi:hypothetical protein